MKGLPLYPQIIQNTCDKIVNKCTKKFTFYSQGMGRIITHLLTLSSDLQQVFSMLSLSKILGP